jgi:hypothetical protein
MKNIFYTALAMVLSITSYAQTFNEAQGTGSGASLTTGDYNTLYGDSSGHSLSSGSLNTIIGYKAGSSQTSAQDNIFIGAGAGGGTTTGTDNVVIGTKAGGWGATAPTASGAAPVGAMGTDNTVIGVEAGMVMETGASDNTIVGEEAGQALTTGDDNVFIGEDAGFNSTTSSDNTFVGSAAGRQNTTGYRNAFFGNEAGYDNTTGFWNTAVGDSAGIDNGVGFMNTFVGHAAGSATEHADHNTFIGTYAGHDNNRTNSTSNANRNTYLGAGTGGTNREGEDNVGIGAGADFGNTNRSRCIFIGSGGSVVSGRSGNYVMVNANDATAIGYQSRTDAQYGIGIGHFNDQHGVQSVSLGYFTNTEAAADYGVLIGATGYLDQPYTVGLGYATSISGNRSIAVGANTAVTADSSFVVGTDGNVSGVHSGALGFGSNVSGSYSVAIGSGSTTAQNNAIVLGGTTTTDRVNVGINTSAPNSNASLELADTDRGFLVNRMTTTLRTTLGGSLSSTDEGMMVYDTDLDGIFVWDGTDWSSATNTDSQDLTLSGNTLSLTNDATTVDLSAYLDNTDTQLTEAEVDAFVANNGYLTTFTEVDGDPTNEIQDISLTGNNLAITSGSTVDLSGYLDNTDTQLTEAEVDAFVANNGYLTTFTEVDGDVTNEIQDISLVGTNLSISSGSTIDLSSIDTDTQLTEAEVDAFVANNGYLTTFTEVDGDVTNEIQDISLSGTDLSISSGSTIDLSSIDTDTQLTEAEVDAFVANNGYLTTFTEVDGDVTNEIQDLSLTGNTLSLTSDATTVDLSAYLDNTDTQLTEAEVDAFVANNGYLTTFTEVDGDPTNEIQDISLSGTDLTISSGSTIDLSSIDTDTQLTEVEVDAFVANNGYITSPDDADADPTNEIQDISLAGTDLTISGGSTIDLSVIDTDTDTDEQDLTAATLTGTVLQIDIENGSSVSVDLAPILANIEAQLIDHETRITELEACACDSTTGLWGGGNEVVENAILYQNIPNPFNNTSSIKYYIPSYANSANLVISNSMGQIVSNIDINEVGAYGTAYVNADGLAVGQYYYTLYVNQSLVDTKKMIVEQ